MSDLHFGPQTLETLIEYHETELYVAQARWPSVAWHPYDSARRTGTLSAIAYHGERLRELQAMQGGEMERAA